MTVLAAAGPPVPCGLDLAGGDAAARDLLTEPPDAIVCANDELALGVHLAAGVAGPSIPGGRGRDDPTAGIELASSEETL